MKKIFLIISLIMSTILFLSINNASRVLAMINPWTDCGQNIVQASKIAGFNFPLELSNYSVKSMDGMIEFSYNIDENRTIIIRKTITDKYSEDISGVYTKYPINKIIRLQNGVPMNIKADFRKIYVMNMSASTGYYSAYCKKGMTKQDLENIYQILRRAEEPKIQQKTYSYIDYSKCELGDLVGDDIKRIKYQNYDIDYHSESYSKDTTKRVAQDCINEGVKTQYEMDCCIRFHMYPKLLER